MSSVDVVIIITLRVLSSRSRSTKNPVPIQFAPSDTNHRESEPVYEFGMSLRTCRNRYCFLEFLMKFVSYVKFSRLQARPATTRRAARQYKMPEPVVLKAFRTRMTIHGLLLIIYYCRNVVTRRLEIHPNSRIPSNRTDGQSKSKFPSSGKNGKKGTDMSEKINFNN